MLKIAFFGTPQIAANLLNNILRDSTFEGKIAFVVTQPDRPVGRKQFITPSPVKQLAVNQGLTVYTTLQSALNNFSEIDVALVFAYGEIIPQNVLSLTPLGFWNIHPSLLPKYRGSSPIAYPLILGDDLTGVSLMKMDQKLDHGPIIKQEKLHITNTETRTDLEARLTQQAYDLLKKLVTEVQIDPEAVNPHRLQEQNHDLATFTRMLQKDDGFIPFILLNKILKRESIPNTELPQIIQDYFHKNNQLSLENWRKSNKNSAQIIYNLYRGLSPWPGIWTNVEINKEVKRLKLIELELQGDQLQIKQVQLEGKNVVDFSTFNTAYKII